MRVGSAETVLIVIRGNSGSGKSTVARRIRERYGRGVALVSQDDVRRTILREKDLPGAANIGLIDTIARYALDAGYHVVVEGILDAGRYGAMLTALRADHAGRSSFCYLDVPFAETVRRHATRPQSREFGEAEMRSWYRRLDLIPAADEQVIGPDSALAETVERIVSSAGLLRCDAHP
ncbi:kinase [Nocardiopsis sediminis]|uniref:Kinase n=1 Tax=Nocardiopsis sediminis TaxID=1778267 RepID=A0ABV8FS13_9ACTN